MTEEPSRDKASITILYDEPDRRSIYLGIAMSSGLPVIRIPAFKTILSKSKGKHIGLG